MKVSRKSYERLTLPWRLMDSWPAFSRVQPAKSWGVTTCEVWRLRLVYPFAWPIAVVVIPCGIALCIAFAAAILPVYPFVKLFEWIGSKYRLRCDFVELTDDAKGART